MQIRFVGLLAIGLLLGCASRADAASVQGSLEAVSPLVLEGTTGIDGVHALLVGSGFVEGSAIHLSAQRMMLRYYERSVPMVGGVSIDAASQTNLLAEEAYGTVDVRLGHPRAGAFVIARPASTDEQTRTQAETQRPLTVFARPAGDVVGHGVYSIPFPHLMLRPTDGSLTITGSIELEVEGANVFVVDGEETRVYETGDQSGSPSAPVWERRTRWITATVSQARLVASPQHASFALFVRDLTAAVEGTIHLEGVQGTLRTPTHEYHADGGKAMLEGNLTFGVTPLHPKDNPVGPEEASGVGLVFSGDLRSTNLAAWPVGGDSTLPQAAVVVGGVAGAILWFLYHRIQPERLLLNPSRRRLLETAQARPALSLRALAREARLAKTTVRYHVQVLARFGLLRVVRQPGARTARVVVATDPRLVDCAKEDALAIALSRQAGQRLAQAVLDCLAANAPQGLREDARRLSLAELTRATGLSKPTALRHLRLFVAAGVLDASNGPSHLRRYVVQPSGIERLSRTVTALGAADTVSRATRETASTPDWNSTGRDGESVSGVHP